MHVLETVELIIGHSKHHFYCRTITDIYSDREHVICHDDDDIEALSLCKDELTYIVLSSFHIAKIWFTLRPTSRKQHFREYCEVFFRKRRFSQLLRASCWSKSYGRWSIGCRWKELLCVNICCVLFRRYCWKPLCLWGEVYCRYLPNAQSTYWISWKWGLR